MLENGEFRFLFFAVCIYNLEQRLITGYYAYQPSTPKCLRRLGGRSPIDGNQ